MSDNIIEYTYETVLLGGSTWRDEIRTVTSRYPGSRVLTVLPQDFGAGTLEQRESIIVVLEVPRAAAPAQQGWVAEDGGVSLVRGPFRLFVVGKRWMILRAQYASEVASGYADSVTGAKKTAKLVAEALLKDEP